VQQISRSELTLSSEVVGRGQYGVSITAEGRFHHSILVYRLLVLPPNSMWWLDRSWEGTSCAIRVAKEEHISAALQSFIVDAVNTMK